MNPEGIVNEIIKLIFMRFYNLGDTIVTGAGGKALNFFHLLFILFLYF